MKSNPEVFQKPNSLNSKFSNTNFKNPPKMAENKHPKPQQDIQASKTTKPTIETNNGASYSGQKAHYPNPPESVNPDPQTLRDQWKFAIRQYSKWYSHAWGTAILAGGAFFALGWFIKGGNPLPSSNDQKNQHKIPDKGS